MVPFRTAHNECWSFDHFHKSLISISCSMSGDTSAFGLTDLAAAFKPPPWCAGLTCLQLYLLSDLPNLHENNRAHHINEPLRQLHFSRKRCRRIEADFRWFIGVRTPGQLDDSITGRRLFFSIMAAQRVFVRYTQSRRSRARVNREFIFLGGKGDNGEHNRRSLLGSHLIEFSAPYLPGVRTESTASDPATA